MFPLSHGCHHLKLPQLEMSSSWHKFVGSTDLPVGNCTQASNCGECVALPVKPSNHTKGDCVLIAAWRKKRDSSSSGVISKPIFRKEIAKLEVTYCQDRAMPSKVKFSSVLEYLMEESSQQTFVSFHVLCEKVCVLITTQSYMGSI
ncbi:Hypothetical predicted protein [Podarcis lilfordi]|uniref:Uncharacterized protein n=1 Tax=Podarcis lilfordi TaxID=74358 RepID=A0AA35LJV9_9SAUR|nr:Hypothetical predicted protein [Podarcis lilfordi]